MTMYRETRCVVEWSGVTGDRVPLPKKVECSTGVVQGTCTYTHPGVYCVPVFFFPAHPPPGLGPCGPDFICFAQGKVPDKRTVKWTASEEGRREWMSGAGEVCPQGKVPSMERRGGG